MKAIESIDKQLEKPSKATWYFIGNFEEKSSQFWITAFNGKTNKCIKAKLHLKQNINVECIQSSGENKPAKIKQ